MANLFFASEEGAIDVFHVGNIGCRARLFVSMRGGRELSMFVNFVCVDCFWNSTDNLIAVFVFMLNRSQILCTGRVDLCRMGQRRCGVFTVASMPIGCSLGITDAWSLWSGS